MTDKILFVRPMNDQDFRIVTREPAASSQSDLNSFEQLVIKGGEVTNYGLHGRIKKAYRLAWAISEYKMIGVSALKQPNQNYHYSVFKKSKSEESPTDWPAELGWIFVKESYREKGIASRLVSSLFDSNLSLNVFATTRANNDPILPIMKKFGFKVSCQPESQ